MARRSLLEINSFFVRGAIIGKPVSVIQHVSSRIEESDWLLLQGKTILVVLEQIFATVILNSVFRFLSPFLKQKFSFVLSPCSPCVYLSYICVCILHHLFQNIEQFSQKYCIKPITAGDTAAFYIMISYYPDNNPRREQMCYIVYTLARLVAIYTRVLLR